MAALFSGACAGTGAAPVISDRITAKHKVSRTTAKGEDRLGLDSRDAILRVPKNAPDGPLPLLVLLHGAGGSGANMLGRISSYCDDAGLAVLSPTSRGGTWDGIRGEIGVDVEFINRALTKTFDVVNVNPRKIILGGFSDGASYALSLGLINGDYFNKIVAFSPGFIVGGEMHGKARIFISHGTRDPILPIDRCSRVIVPALKRQNFDVTYTEFNGVHEITPDVAREALTWAAS